MRASRLGPNGAIAEVVFLRAGWRLYTFNDRQDAYPTFDGQDAYPTFDRQDTYPTFDRQDAYPTFQTPAAFKFLPSPFDPEHVESNEYLKREA